MSSRGRLLAAPRGHEWLELVKYWREGGDQPDLLRRRSAPHRPGADRSGEPALQRPLRLAVRLRRDVRRRRPARRDGLVGDRRPAGLVPRRRVGADAGDRRRRQPGRQGAGAPGGAPSAGFGAGPARCALVIGGRNLGAAGAPRCRVHRDARRPRRRHAGMSRRDPGFFLRSAGPAGRRRWRPARRRAARAPDRFAELRVTATAGRRRAPTPVAAAVEQFDLQTPDAVMFGYDEGWHEDEYNPRTGLRWRWASDRGRAAVWNGGRDVRVRLSVESPLQTFDEAPIVTLTAGDRELARLTPRRRVHDRRSGAGRRARGVGRAARRWRRRRCSCRPSTSARPIRGVTIADGSGCASGAPSSPRRRRISGRDAESVHRRAVIR